MKAFTDVNQSKQLAEILSIESADCFWDYDDRQKFHRISWFEDGYNKHSQLMLNENNIPAWSLAALLAQMPCVVLESSRDNHYRTFWHDMYSEWHESAVDACVELILRERKEEEK